MSTPPPRPLPLTGAPSEPAEAWNHEGAVLAGRYRIEGLGEPRSAAMEEAVGRAGILVPAIDLARARVSVGVFRFSAGSGPAAAFSALAFALAAKAIQSEHALRVLDAAVLDEQTLLIVTEACSVIDLGELVESCGPLPVLEAIEIILEACAAVAEAHALGIHHGDLAPARLLSSRCLEGRLAIKVAGFGAPRRAHVDPRAPIFRAPEQLTARAAASPRADIWSLGATLFYLLTGAPPFAADTPSAQLHGILHGAPLGLRLLRPGVSVALERVVLRCLEKDPADRYASVADLALALRAFAPHPSEGEAAIGRAERASWLRAVVIFAIVGFAAFTGLAFSTARRSDVLAALRPFQSLLAADASPPREPRRPAGQ
jgi:hypothetical protein